MTWNNFKGRAKRIDDIDLPKIGHLIGVGEDEIHAVIDVECANSGFDAQGRPRILFERHHFYRQLSGEKRDRALAQKLAVRRWSRATYGQDQYKLLERAMKIDTEAALKSCSWGMGQIMGWNHTAAGYQSVQDMVRAFMDDEENHLIAMVNFIKTNRLDDELRAHDWAGFAKGYNGAGYKANRYDEKLARSYAKWSRIKNTPWSPEQEARTGKLEQLALDADKPGLKSSTNKAVGVGGITTTLLAAKPVMDAVNGTKDAMSGLLDAGPWVLLAIIGIGAGIYIWKERQRKAKMAKEVL